MIDESCTNCKHCDLYEDENTTQSEKYYCRLTEERIIDIELDFCDKFEKE